MIRLLRHWFYLVSATGWLALAFIRAALHVKTRILRDLALPHPETLSSGEKRRLQHYFYGTTYLSVVFCVLRGYPRTRREKHLFTNLAALAYFFDDLVDSFRAQDDSGVAWQDNPEQYGQTADPRGLALHFLYNIYRELPSGDLKQFKVFMHRVFNVETAGRQHPGNAGVAEIERITAEKGGFSVLMFRRVLAHPLTEPEQEALFQFGYLVQLCDDVFDLWHDRKAGIVTLATHFAERNDVESLRQLFEKQVVVVRKAISRAVCVNPTPDPSPNGRGEVLTVRSTSPLPLGEGSGVGSRATAGGGATQAVIHFIVSITRVCLQHYADLQKKHGTLPLDNRAAMVVDMERWHNRLRAARELLTADS